jgi:hypothetical protein
MFKNFDDFVKKIKIPFYEDYQIRIVDNRNDEDIVCFDLGEIIKINYFIGLIAILALLI